MVALDHEGCRVGDRGHDLVEPRLRHDDVEFAPHDERRHLEARIGVLGAVHEHRVHLAAQVRPGAQVLAPAEQQHLGALAEQVAPEAHELGEGVAVVAVYSFVVTWILMMVLHKPRVSPEQEREGLDKSEFGEEAYYFDKN